MPLADKQALQVAAVQQIDQYPHARRAQQPAHQPQRLGERGGNAEELALGQGLSEYRQVQQDKTQAQPGQQDQPQQLVERGAAPDNGQPQAGQQQRGKARQRQQVGVAQAGDDPAVDDRPQGDAQGQWGDQQPGVLGRIAVAALQQQRQIKQQGKHDRPGRHRQHKQPAQARHAKQGGWQQGVGAVFFPAPQHQGSDHTHHAQCCTEGQAGMPQPLDKQLQAA